uniref:HDC06626 n=1 Tax=Drosophila melanogaster TaxID=7227 RepID=Q6IGC7_DROME|nr:TPA_inf: HDC06626 [Drosophila melanogaster]
MCPAQIACCGVIEINYEPHLHCGWLSGAVRSGLRAFSTPNGICLALIGDRLRRRQEKFVRQLAAVKETELRIDVIPMAAITHQCPSKLTLHLRVVSSGALGP